MNVLRYISVLIALLWVVNSTAQTDTTAVIPEEAPTQAAAPTTPTTGNDLAARWDAANTAYINNDFAKAIEGYEAILASGEHSAKLYYNLANAYFKSEQTGRAILYYNRALRLKPGDEDIRHNLSVAEARTKDTIEAIPEFFLTQWLRDIRHLMSATTWSVLSLLFVVVLGLGLLCYLLGTHLSLRKIGFYTMLCALFLTICTTWFALAGRNEQLGEDRAIVMTTSAAVKSSPDRAATDLFILHEGTEVEISNTLDGWCEVTIADGKKGWTEHQKIEVI